MVCRHAADEPASCRSQTNLAAAPVTFLAKRRSVAGLGGAAR